MTREEYFANLKSAEDALHYGVGHLQGGHSGRYPYGSGKVIKKGTKSYIYGYDAEHYNDNSSIYISPSNNNKNRKVSVRKIKAKKDLHMMDNKTLRKYAQDIIKDEKMKKLLLKDAETTLKDIKELNKGFEYIFEVGKIDQKEEIKRTKEDIKNIKNNDIDTIMGYMSTNKEIAQKILDMGYDGFIGKTYTNILNNEGLKVGKLKQKNIREEKMFK